MGLNLDAIKAKLNQLNKNDDRRSNLWKPEAGPKTRVRIVPYVHRKDNPFLELYFHYDIAKRSMLSPVSFGNADPVVEFAEKLKKTGDKDEWLMGRKIEPKMRTYVPVIVRGKEAEGVKFWGFGKTVYQELLGVIADPDYGDITDATNGRDIGIERQTPAEAGNQYGKTTVRVKPNQTAITDDAETLKGIFENQSELTELYNEPTYDELKDVLQTFLNPSEETEASVPMNTTEKVAQQTATKSTADVSDAFDNLFNN